jgi:spore coat polysaccharide biosynthesis protein SpsF (cytidylyltransferase family)
VLLPFGDSTILEQISLRLKDWQEELILATSRSKSDTVLSDWAISNQIKCYRGSENDVLSRFLEASHAPFIARICSDNPFLQVDPIAHWFELLNNGYDYVSYCDAENTPAILTHWGLFPEVMRRDALEKVSGLVSGHPKEAFYREHVSRYIYEHPDQFNLCFIPLRLL